MILSRYWNVPPQCDRQPASYRLYLHKNQSCIILYFCLCPQIKIQLQSEVASEQDRLLLSASLFSSVNKSNLNLLSLNIFSEKFTVGYILLHKCLKIKGKTIRKGFYLLFFYCSFSLWNHSHADVDGLSSTQKTAQFLQMQGNRISEEIAKSRSKWKIFFNNMQGYRKQRYSWTL